jgi:hypothetical protein
LIDIKVNGYRRLPSRLRRLEKGACTTGRPETLLPKRIAAVSHSPGYWNQHAIFRGLEIHRESGVAELQFATSEGIPFDVTISLGYLGQLYRFVSEKIREEPDLFSFESK